MEILVKAARFGATTVGFSVPEPSNLKQQSHTNNNIAHSEKLTREKKRRDGRSRFCCKDETCEEFSHNSDIAQRKKVCCYFVLVADARRSSMIDSIEADMSVGADRMLSAW